MPAVAKIDSGRMFVMIIVVRLSQHQDVNEKQVMGGIAQSEILIPIFMSKPVDDGSMKGPHQNDKRQ